MRLGDGQQWWNVGQNISHLPVPPTREVLVRAIRASLSLLELAPDSIIVPLWAAAWRAILGASDFSEHLAGPTGTGKTELAALVQQHFGAEFDARHLLGSWASTGNALEGLMFEAKDAAFVIDDFAPTGTSTEIARMHREADQMLCAQGNRSGRQRMRADTTLKPPKPPRGSNVSTGEDVPRGEGLEARVFIVEVSPSDMDWQRLAQYQVDAASGLYAQATAAYIQWLAPRYGGDAASPGS